VIVEITDTVRMDEDEIIRRRAFRLFWPYAAGMPVNAWTTLTEDLIDPDGLEAPDHALNRRIVRRMAQEIAKGRGPLTTFHGQLLADMLRLAGTLLQAGN
jgi:hypothetical protein